MRLTSRRSLPILDFDIETRRVGFHSAGKFSPDGCEPVAIACSWVGEDKVRVWALDTHKPEEMLLAFRAFYEEAGILTGHYIRPFDLPIVNGALLERGLPLLAPKLTCDTKKDLRKVAGLSQSQENLSLMLQLERDKFHMSDHNWRGVARLEADAMKECRKRVVDDVKQHKLLRERLISLKALKAPRVWAP